MKIVPASELLEISKNYTDYRARREASWYGYTEEKKWGAIPFSASTLYRGQNARYLPMLPSIARGLQSSDIGKMYESSISDQALIVLRLAQSWWFSKELSYHPISLHAARQGLDLDPIALAQHYGIPTGFLDLTDDFNVSAFFATCQETKSGWQAVDSGTGVIYRVNLRNSGVQSGALTENPFQTPFGNYTPIGPQQLPRPSEQCAWMTELPLCHSFEGWPNVDMLLFHHDRDIGKHFLGMYAGGERLFPVDPLANVAAEILACREIPIDIVDAALDSFSRDPYGILSKHLPALRKEISTLATQVNYRRLLLDQCVAPLLSDQEWVEKRLADVKVKWVPVRRITIPQKRADPKADVSN